MAEARVLLSWSSGKDCAWSLQRLRADPSLEVVGLFTTLNAAEQRVAMHGTRLELVEAQAHAMGLPLHPVPLPWPCSNADYERLVGDAMRAAAREGVTHLAFGDLHLEDVRAYREAQLTGTGIAPLFPLWGEDTAGLARRMIEAGVDAVVTCVDLSVLSRELVGRPFDQAFLDGLPPGVDPCGERGEFHTCVVDGPMFREAVATESRGIREANGFAVADLALSLVTPPAADVVS